ncbi:Intramolecular chaperone auto-processing domain containing protein [uncultured Caudovirales phage]|uniref:Intramolecular chaperone auto-processing domain containing protein n=1 Tax=uncultured Caudovirales phage TaxID=2100421 RepID=A0A6J5M2R2_9CAUD|nr:Intramolecular chaperone auto-processing domain containing protein [uncultured Caudovirales phage]
MGKSAAKAPKAPDPAIAARAQGAANVDAAVASGLMNMVNQQTPYGNLQYTQSGTQTVGSGNDAREVPIYSATTTLSPAEQRQLDLNNQINEQALTFGQKQLGSVESALQNPMSFDGLPNINRDTSADRQRIEDTVYRRMTGRLDDRFGRDQAGMENKLANQGIAQGSEAWQNAQKDFSYGKNDAYQGAADQAILAGGQEQNRLFGLDLQGRQQGIQERSLQRSQPVNELATMLGFGGGVQSPQFTNTGGGGSVAPVDYIGLMNNQYNAQMNNYNARLGQQQANMNGLFGLAGSLGSAAIMSDIRTKENIEQVGTLENGLPIYSYNYIGGEEIHIGVMAQEVQETTPEAVQDIDGFLHVNYAKVMQ